MISKQNIFILVLTLTSLFSFSQEKYTISGTISDKKSNETLIGVSVYIPELKAGVNTNEYGFYSLTLPKGNYTIQISYVGYSLITESISLNGNLKNNYSLSNDENKLDEVIVTGESKYLNPEIGQIKLAISTIKKMPVVLGEVDIIKSMLLLPGVTSAGEGASGFNVRGGGADQNLILMDEATIYNSSHVFGFFSIFNPDAVKDIKLYKGGIINF